MERYNLIVQDELYIDLLKRLEVAEADRIFCRHGIGHLLDVARIAYIMVLECGADYSKDVVYAAGLLHDIGRLAQYETGVGHHEAGVPIVKDIMGRCGYSQEEIAIVCEAVGAHRREQEASRNLSEFLYKADKKSRNCFMCQAYDECNWDENKKNKGVI